MVQKVGPKDEQGDLCLKDKFDAANSELKLGSHGGDLDRTKLSFGFRIGGTSDLESLGSIQPSLHIPPPLQMAQCCRRCLCCGMAFTWLP